MNSITGPQPPIGEFHTWSEIAHYLGVSVREAQNREKNDGMPVHRLPGKKPRVWALRSELDAWKTQAGASAPGTNGGVADRAKPPEVLPLGDQRSVTERHFARRALLGIAGTAAAAIGGSLLFHSRVGRTERAVLSGNLLTAMDGLGGTLWTHRFAGTLQPQTDDDNTAWRVQVLDLEATGNPGVLTVCSRLPEPSALQPVSDELFYFGPEGRIRWTHSLRPGLLDFDGQPLEPVWRFSHVIPVPWGKQQTIWAGVHHGWRWPGCVMRFDAVGSPSVQFANSGFVERLCRMTRPDGEFIAVSGENNAFDRAFVAVIGIHDPPSSSPAGGAKRCYFANAPPGSPRDYTLFPTTEMLIAEDAPYGQALQMYPTNDGGFVAEVRAAYNQRALFLYEFSARTRCVSCRGQGPILLSLRSRAAVRRSFPPPQRSGLARV